MLSYTKYFRAGHKIELDMKDKEVNLVPKQALEVQSWKVTTRDKP